MKLNHLSLSVCVSLRADLGSVGPRGYLGGLKKENTIVNVKTSAAGVVTGACPRERGLTS